MLAATIRTNLPLFKFVILKLSMNKGLLYLCITVGGIVGSYIPVLFGAGGLSMISIMGGVVGSFAGIWAAIKLNDRI